MTEDRKKYLRTHASDKTIVKMWITKYAGTKGLYQLEGYVSDRGVFVAGEFKFFQTNEFFPDFESAKAQALKKLKKSTNDIKSRLRKIEANTLMIEDMVEPV